jgi:hypothetical protein
MQIINQSGNSVLASGSTIKYDKSMFDSGLKSFPQPSLYNENTLIYTAKITGGYGLWQKDIGSLNRLHMEIKNAVEKLKLANSMLIEEEKIKRSVLEESEKTQLMEQLEKEISGHIGKLSDIIKNIENSEEEQKATIRVLLMLCYIKRRCSLFFREKEAAVISPDELKHYFDELANSPEYEGNKIIITSDLRKPVQVRYATLFYDIFYNFMDWTLGLDYPNIHAHLQTKGEIMFLGLVSSADVRNFHIDVALHEAIIQAKGEYAIVDLDGNLGIRLTFTGSNEND